MTPSYQVLLAASLPPGPSGKEDLTAGMLVVWTRIGNAPFAQNPGPFLLRRHPVPYAFLSAELREDAL